MLSEGTKTRDGEALSNALQLLGTTVDRVGRRRERVDQLPLDGREVRADARHPRRHAAELDVPGRRRSSGCAASGSCSSTQARRSPARSPAACSRASSTATQHPYGRVVTEDSIKAITRDDVVAFHKAYFQPGRALITVVGDTTAAAVKPVIEKALAAWPQGRREAGVHVPGRRRAARPTTIYLVDKPGAAQSTFAIGAPGPPRNTPDYFALQVMNTILGGMFQSRLNANIREEKGYSYGVSSSFGFGKGPGPSAPAATSSATRPTRRWSSS